jgi:tetratricopeptide (TPR) repeat protein
LIDEKAYDRAKALLINLPKKWQKQHRAQAYLGYAQFYLEEYEDAISCFDFVLEDKINAGNILFMRALAKDYLNQVPAAIADYERVLQINPRAELVHRNLGLLCETAGKPVEAREYYRQALEIDPEDEASRQRLKKV